MPIIVANRETGQQYVLVGSGFAMTETALPGMFLGNLSPDVDTKAYGIVAVCDDHGNIHWVRSRDVVVVEVDGRPPASLVARPLYR